MSEGNEKALKKSRGIFATLLDSTKVIKDSVRFFLVYPVSFIPLIGCWSIYAAVILYMKFYFSWEGLSTSQSLLIVYGVYFCFSMIIGFTAMVLLEMVQQVETTGIVDLPKAYTDTITKNLLRAFPILVVWSLIWFILMVIEAILSKNKKDSGGSRELTAQSAVETLSGMNEGVSISSLAISGLNKGLRMMVFIILPAVAWEDKGPMESVKKGMKVMRAAAADFAASFVVTGAFNGLIVLPVALVVVIGREMEIVYPDMVWYGLLIYAAFAWSISFLSEQLNVANLYLWYMKWESESIEAVNAGREPKSLKETEKPSYFDDQFDLQ